jgi:uncharacterized protein DUF6992
MKHIIILCTVLAMHNLVFGQYNFNDSISSSRNRITKTAMVTLGSWAVANIASGFIVAGHSRGEAKYAWSMNGYWNFINLGLATMGYLNAVKASRKKNTFEDNYEAQHALEKIYIFNFGLDLAYIAGGFYLRERGKSTIKMTSADQLKGYGTSIIIQGAFLLLMDGVMIRLHQRNTARMNKKLRQLVPE